MVELSATAAEILARCESDSTVRDIIARLKKEYEGNDLVGDVVEFLEEAARHGWIRVQRSG
jgi:pyrroloquinoline quinone biosynthesis protein D